MTKLIETVPGSKPLDPKKDRIETVIPGDPTQATETAQAMHNLSVNRLKKWKPKNPSTTNPENNV